MPYVMEPEPCCFRKPGLHSYGTSLLPHLLCGDARPLRLPGAGRGHLLPAAATPVCPAACQPYHARATLVRKYTR